MRVIVKKDWGYELYDKNTSGRKQIGAFVGKRPEIENNHNIARGLALFGAARISG